eukprot:jgi/Chrpa1/4287/Chrysochromulina_OHIO_Genome00016077-RA
MSGSLFPPAIGFSFVNSSVNASVNASALEIFELDAARWLGALPLPHALITALADLERLPKLLAFALSLVACVLAYGLIDLQRVASRRDEVAVISLQRLMLAIDADAEGSISRSELRTKFFAYFVLPLASAPAVNAQHDAGGARDGALAARARHEATQRERQQKLAVQQGEREFEFFWSELKKNADG